MGNSPSEQDGTFFNDMTGAPAEEACELKQAKQITVFFIRHGQSTWNIAQDEWDIKEMLTKTDHPLTDCGIEQCEELRARVQACEENPAEAIAAELRFLQAQKVYCSPLTRAVQTALITTQTLLSKEIPLHLMPEAREIKKMGGRDSSGNIAENLRPRVAAKLKEYYGDTRAHELGAVDWNVDDLVIVNDSKTGEDTMPQWWNSIMESEAEVKKRAAYFMQQLRRGPEVSVVVGHSLFFQKIFKIFLSKGCDTSIGSIPGMTTYEGLTKHKLCNCGIVQCLINFSSPDEPKIEKVELIFGTKVEIAGESDAESESESE